MARQTLVLDASVGVKWFSAIGEAHVPQARAVLAAYTRDDIGIIVPDIFFHEQICNALVHKKMLSLDLIEDFVVDLFRLRLSVPAPSEDRQRKTVQIARQAGITEYDACYAALAIENHCPLVTANPRHQSRGLGCEVIPIEEYRE